jgi:ADP-ribose pyrophosphatase YjhB (NUDIX family)
MFGFCPRCGSEGLRPKEENFLACGACGLGYFINPAIAVTAVIVERGGRILLVKRAYDPMKGKLDLPGGFVNLDESAEDALKREIKEELDIRLESYEFFMSCPNEYHFGGVTYFTLDLAFICRVNEHKGIAVSDEIEDYVLVTPGEIGLEEIAFASTRSILERYRSVFGARASGP